jgi:hypothetical protein
MGGATLLLGITNRAGALEYVPPAGAQVLSRALPLFHNILATRLQPYTQKMGTASLFILWMVVGAVVYALGWFVLSILYNLVRRKAYARKQLAAIYCILAMSGGGLVFLLYTLYGIVLPAVSDTAPKWITPHSITAYVWIVVCVVALSFYLYAMLTVCRMFWHTVRFVNTATQAQRRATRELGRGVRS